MALKAGMKNNENFLDLPYQNSVIGHKYEEEVKRMSKKILQIIPATGWRAVYSKEKEDKTPAFDLPVSCFALIQEASEHEFVERIIPIIYGEFWEDAESDNFLGCVGPGVAKDSVGLIEVEYGKENEQVYKIIKNERS